MRFITAMLVLMLGAVANAVPVAGLYSSLVPVEDKSDVAREGAERSAFMQVLRKVSGDQSILDNPSILKASPKSYLSSFGYVSDSGTRAISFQAEFSQMLVDRFLKDQGIAVWGENRPRLLLWVQVLDGQARQVLAQDSGLESEKLLSAMSQAGLPAILPSYSREARGLFPNNSYSNFPASSIEGASEGYQQDGHVVARIINRGDGWRVTGYMKHHGMNQPLEATFVSLSEAYEGLSSLVAGYLSRKYAILGDLTVSEEAQTLVINQVGSYGDYQKVLGILKKTPGVKTVQLVGAQGSSIRVSLGLQVSWQQVLNNLTLEPRLNPGSTPGIFVWSR